MKTGWIITVVLAAVMVLVEVLSGERGFDIYLISYAGGALIGAAFWVFLVLVGRNWLLFDRNKK